jgi:poly-gamma-glutamate synthesis protein (capsule biosynthesis protein)
MSARDPWAWSGTVPDDAVTLLLVGDINVQKRDDPDSVFADVRGTLNAADLVYGNLEGLLVPSEGPHQDIPNKAGWQHVGAQSVAALEAGNVSVVGAANNVSFGREKIMESLRVLDAHRIAHTGAGANTDAAHAPAIVERKGIRIGFLQYTAKWYAQDHQIATGKLPGMARLLSADGTNIEAGDLARACADIEQLRGQVDFLVVSSHNRDGHGRPSPPELLAESRPLSVTLSPDDPSLVAPIQLGSDFQEVEPYQRAFARAAIDAGADIVFGHGSHVVQGVEIYRDKPVMYCLANFAMDWVRMTPNKGGLMARAILRKEGLLRLSLLPASRDDANNVLLLDPSEGEGAQRVAQLRELSPGTPLPLDGQEIALIDTAGVLS